MKQVTHLSLLFSGCVLIILGFLLPWYASSGLYLSGPYIHTISGWQLWLGGRSVTLAYAPGSLPEFFTFLWLLPATTSLVGIFRMFEFIFPRRWDGWLCLRRDITFLAIGGIFLYPALFHATLQIGLDVCLGGWWLLLLGILARFFSRESHTHQINSPMTQTFPVQHTRRKVLRGLTGIVGFASAVGTGGVLLWKQWRARAAIATYRYQIPLSIQKNTSGDPVGNIILSVDWSPEGGRILVAQLQAPPQSWDALTGEKIRTYQPAEANAAAWSRNGKHIALSQRNFPELPFLFLVNATTGSQETHLTLQISQMHGLEKFAWSPDSQYIAMADSIDPMIKFWHPMTGKMSQPLLIQFPDRSETSRFQDLAWSPNGEYLAATICTLGMLPNGTMVGGRNLAPSHLSGAYVWHVESGKLLFHYQAAIPFVAFGGSLLSWAPDGKQLACINKTTVQILDLPRRIPILTYTGHPLIPTALAWSSDGQYLASGGYDRTVQVWEPSTGALRFLYQGHTAMVSTLAWSPDSYYLVSGSADGTAQVWQPDV